jgi:ABC-type oligopeptide transport system substrate-binding subunit
MGNQGLFEDIRVRKAFNLAIDKELIVNTILGWPQSSRRLTLPEQMRIPYCGIPPADRQKHAIRDTQLPEMVSAPTAAPRQRRPGAVLAAAHLHTVEERAEE